MNEASADNELDLVARFADGRVGAAALAGWAAAEAIVLPIVPDVGLGLLVLAAPPRAVRLFAAVVAGAVAGTLVLAAFMSGAPDAARDLLLAIPAIDASVLAEADRALAEHGVAGFAQVGPGPPLKVYTVEWLGRGGDVAGTLVGAVLNRVTRIGPVLVVGVAGGYVARPWLRRHARLTLVAYAGLWLAFYVAYFSSGA